MAAIKNKKIKRNCRSVKKPELIIFVGFIVMVAIFVIGLNHDAATSMARHAAKAKIRTETKLIKGFTECYYYERENLARYKKYQKKNPEIPAADVVWQVNANLDNEAYDERTVKKADLDDGSLILVSKRNGLDKDYVPSNLVELPNGLLAAKPAAKAYVKLVKAAEKEGYHLYAQSAYRSYKKQVKLHMEYANTDNKAADYSAKPGYSEHQTGLAIDVNNVASDYVTEFSHTRTAVWLKENAHRFGFIIRYTEENSKYTGYTAESWHIRYIGRKHATVIYEKGITSYEEYKVKYIDHHQ